MEQSTIRGNRWNEAARYGLVFGAISVAYFYIGHLQIPGILGFVLWAVKFVGCIKLMQYVMKKFASANPAAGRPDIFRLGILIAVLSALVFSTVAVADMLYFFLNIIRQPTRQSWNSIRRPCRSVSWRISRQC